MNLAARIFASVEAKADHTLLTVVGRAGEVVSTRRGAELLGEAARWRAAYEVAGVGAGDVVALTPPRDHRRPSFR